MREFPVALIFCGICAMCGYMAARGYRGTATNLTDGWGEHMPEAMLTDPAARARVNRMVARWETGAALLCLPGAGYALAAAFDTQRELDLPILLMLAVYGILVCSIASYPIEKLKE